ncbi:hypothetical protein F0562_028760 [Nyssa sinensis]|uniref:MYB transcription factor n=1 Tax=Nyssa sinensis TaxID=561372 RepID=A0A5J5B359_9ASTE|nr:hypothetical protein F0562_028760 [Nyssa sinensis]
MAIPSFPNREQCLKSDYPEIQPQKQSKQQITGPFRGPFCLRVLFVLSLMGAPKQKWTPEEEAALKAGVVKHGAGKWRTILKDPEFSGVLYLRSNVDLKDKWRNMSVMANGWGSREKARLALKRMQHVPKQDENSMALSTVVQSDEEIVDAKSLAVSSGSPRIGVPKRSIIRLDNLIIEAINNLKEPGGSNKMTIATYIEEQYWAPPNFKRLLSAKLKSFDWKWETDQDET